MSMTLARDLRFALRRLAMHPASTLAAVTLLALGIGTAVLMADMLDRLLIRPPAHVGAPDRVARLYTQSPKTGTVHPLITNVVTMERLGSALTRRA